MILSDTLRWNISGSLIPKEFFAQLSLEHLKPSSFFCIFFVYLIFGFLTIYSFKSDVLQFLKKKTFQSAISGTSHRYLFYSGKKKFR